jgi:hypothetical protein
MSLFDHPASAIASTLLLAVSCHGDVFSHVPEAADFVTAYELEIPENGAFQAAVPIPYTVNNSATAAPDGFDRVAYYLELTDGPTISWVYASMDAFTNSVSATGLPHAADNNVIFQQGVSNLTVLSNVVGVRNGSFDRGQIEMWHHSYQTANPTAVYAASATGFDWGDSRTNTNPSGYGSFQVHNPAARQTVFAYNRWASASGGSDDIGIGNGPGTHPDWTLEGNAATYTGRKLVILVRPTRFNVVFTDAPVNHQVTPRDTSTNVARVPVSGDETLGGFEQAVLKILRNGVPYGTDGEQDLNYAAGSAPFSFSPEIPAELASYTFELHLKRNGNLHLVRRITDVTAGDVYLWYGQSNGEARKFPNSTTSAAYASPWIRTFGVNSDSATVTQAYPFWVEADGDAYMELPAGIGQWPLVVARGIVDTYGIPVAVLNGSRAAYSMPQLQRDDSNPDNLADGGGITRTYNRLRYRAIQANVADKIRAMFFYQGESDANNALQHATGFASLMTDWQVDYPALEKILLSQVHVGCGGNIVARELPELRNAQRLFADVHDNVHVMSTNGLITYTDNCHFFFTGGYETHGLNVFRQVQRELYGAPDSPAIDPPNPDYVEFSASDKLRIVMRKSGAGIVVGSGSLADFRLNGSSANLVSATVTDNAIELEYDGPVATATSLDYLGRIGYLGGWIRNSNGVGLLAFSEPIIGEPILSDDPQLTLISPIGVTELVHGSEFPLSAGATSPADSIVRMEILINGILHTAVNGTGSIATHWTVPASGSHSILFRAIDSADRTVEKSVVILAGITTAPGGVGSGLNVWLRPESGIIRDANGAVSAWQDGSGNNHGAVQASASAQPAYQPNSFGVMPGIAFDGNDILTATGGMSTGSYTKVVRVLATAFDGSRNILSSGNTSNTPVRHALFNSSSPSPSIWHKGTFVTSSTPMVAGQSHLIVATYDSATKQGALYLDGSPVGTGTAASGDNVDPTYHLGGLGGALFMQGSIGEVIIYNRVISPAERAAIEGYLNAKTVAPPAATLLDFTHWSEAHINPPADAGATGDANSNGIPNLIEFALGFEITGPRAPLEFSSEDTGYHIAYSRPTDRTGVVYQLLKSSDMTTWVPVSDLPGPVTNGMEQRIYPLAPNPPNEVFFMLKVTMN